MSKRRLTAEEMRLKGLQMIREAREKERRQREETRAELGKLVEQYIDEGFDGLDLPIFISQIERITGKKIILRQQEKTTTAIEEGGN